MTPRDNTRNQPSGQDLQDWEKETADIQPLARPPAQTGAKTGDRTPPEAAPTNPMAETSGATPTAASVKTPAAVTPAVTASAAYQSRAAPPLTDRGPDSKRADSLDAGSRRKLQRGQYPIDRRLDLHGMTEAQAAIALAAEVEEALRQKQRCLHVVTGKGRGVLKDAVKRWAAGAAPWAPSVIGRYPAHARHGGAGACYLLLRRARVPLESG